MKAPGDGFSGLESLGSRGRALPACEGSTVGRPETGGACRARLGPIPAGPPFSESENGAERTAQPPNLEGAATAFVRPAIVTSRECDTPSPTSRPRMVTRSARSGPDPCNFRSAIASPRISMAAAISAGSSALARTTAGDRRVPLFRQGEVSSLDETPDEREFPIFEPLRSRDLSDSDCQKFSSHENFFTIRTSHPHYIRQGGHAMQANYFTPGQVARLLGRKPGRSSGVSMGSPGIPPSSSSPSASRACWTRMTDVTSSADGRSARRLPGLPDRLATGLELRPNQGRLTLGRWLDKYESDLVPGLWTARSRAGSDSSRT